MTKADCVDNFSYSVVVLIKEAFKNGDIARVFDCADNSGFRP
jgi:hypothetical protein